MLLDKNDSMGQCDTTSVVRYMHALFMLHTFGKVNDSQTTCGDTVRTYAYALDD